MKERPIIFSGEMVRAILDGRKTQTRRVISPQPSRELYEGEGDASVWFPQTHHSAGYRCPYGKVGDQLWVKEATGINQFRSSRSFGERIYRATQRVDPDYPMKWIPARLMPREVSRITLEITEVRVERLQDISEEDAKAEGVKPIWLEDDDNLIPPHDSYREGFAYLWDKINGKKHPWAENPYVWVIGFRRIV